MKKLLILIVLAMTFGSCVTVYRESTVIQYKGKAELLTDSMTISVNNHELIQNVK